MKQKKTYIILLMLMCAIGMVAQERVLTGKVTEKLDNGAQDPIIGANVVLVNNQNRYIKGAVTDIDGNYMLQVPADAKNLKVRVTYIGMKTVTVNYNGQTEIDFAMESESVLEEVTVTGTRGGRDGMGVSRLEQTSAVQRVDLASIVETAPVTSVEEALQGQIAGLDINLGGDPGARSSIRIRGTSSLSASNEPLIVIDGVPQDVDITDDFNFSTANEEDFGALLNIAPANIESIEVLKDASATAIYGTKGANGVLLINTKKGAMGKTKFSFSSKFTAKKEPESIPLLNGAQYVSLMQDAIWNAANAKGISNARNEMDMLFNNPEINYDPNYRYYDEYNVDTDWLEAVKQDAIITDNNFSMTGGGEKAVYKLNLGYYDEQGTTKGTGVQRLSAGMKITYNFSDRLRVRTDFSFSNTNKDANALSSVRSIAMQKMPNLSPYWIDDVTKQPTDVYFSRDEDFQGSFTSTGSSSVGSANYNPVAMVKEGYNKTTQRDEKMTITLQYDFPFNLQYQGWVSLNMRTTKNKQFLPQEATGVLWTSSFANRSVDASTDAFSLQTENKLIYNNTFAEKHKLIATALIKTADNESFSYTSGTYGNASANLSDPVVGSVVASSGSGNSERRSISMIGQAVYSYDNRYIIRGTINHEGNSTMGKEKRWGTFPAFGASWNIEQEHFWSDSFKKWFNEGKVRFGYGWSGTSPSGASIYLGAYKSLGQYMDMAAITPDRMQLDNLKWETTREMDLGIDLRLFNKLSFTFDYYDKQTSDMLLKDTKLPASTGYNSVKYINSGKMSNKGVEIRFEYQVFKNKEWTVSVNANVSRNINKVKELPSTWVMDNYSFGNGNYALRIVENAPVGSFYGYRYLGVYQNTAETYARDASGNVMYDWQGNIITMKNGTVQTYPGDAKYEDINHDGVINENDIVYLGNANPKFFGGGGFQIRWKDLTLTTFFYGRYGQKVINGARISLENMYGKNNQSTAVLHRWRAEGDQTDIPRALYGMGYNYLGSDRFVENASFIRLKTLSLSYNLPKKWLKNWGVSKLNVFATAYDLFTWTKYKGQDPEVSMPSATSLVRDNATTPVSRRFAIGVNLDF
ncbi:MAG: TonB-dependent receptor [Prevotella sp.]|nr:TonB-dependent receptor [Prevotella sp.]